MIGVVGQWFKSARALRQTAGSVWRRRVTRAYPRRAEIPRLRPFLVADEQIRCVACHLCESACPTDALFIETQQTPSGYRANGPKSAELDLGRCLVCGLCVASCPEDAIQLGERGGWSAGLRTDLLQHPLTRADG